MRTKLAYVLTCSKDSLYIEQALISVFSARHWNPDAHIVLLVDDKTDKLLVGSRGLINNYISEKIVVPFSDENISTVVRSRIIKTSVRQRISGDFLFIDCDTVICKSLESVDDFQCEVGAVPDSLIPISEFGPDALRQTIDRCKKYGYDIMPEEFYFCSGVMYVKDTEKAHRLYKMWNDFYLSGYGENGIADQPPLGKANILANHIISRIPDSYNNIIFTQNPYYKEAHILHISSYRNPSYLFSSEVLTYIKHNGLSNEWMLQSILNPTNTFLPFDSAVVKYSISEKIEQIRSLVPFFKGYARHIDKSFVFFSKGSFFIPIEFILLKCHQAYLALSLWMIRKSVKTKRKTIKMNGCAK